MGNRKRLGIFGWGVVAPKTPDVKAFEKNLQKATNWLEPFDGFGPNNFLVGMPDFNFADYKPWIDKRFEPRKFSQLDNKMGNAVKYAIGAFIQSLNQNKGMEQLLEDLGQEAHIYVGTGLGDYPLQYEVFLTYYKTQKRWNRFWCQHVYNSKMSMYDNSPEHLKSQIREALEAPEDPAGLNEFDAKYDDVRDAWFAFWVQFSEGLKNYLRKIRAVESTGIKGDIDSGKGHVIRHKVVARKKINREYGCPTEPWACIDPKILWNIPNIAAAQISMLGRITGATIAPVAACSGFTTALKLADNAIQLGQAKACVVGMTDAEPNPLTVGAFYGARVISHDGQASKPLTELRGTHISGGSCIWIVGDYDYLTAKGMKPLGLEIKGIGLSADAHHIITPNADGPQAAIQAAMANAGISSQDIDTWDMHATATPGDWTELNSAVEMLPDTTLITARKGSFGHGMSVCGGWELTAQHMGLAKGQLLPINVDLQEFHEMIRPHSSRLVRNQPVKMKKDMGYAGKINMGVGGINACVFCKPWDKKTK